MMGTWKTLTNVSKGQDPYSVIGNYIRNHITAIEDMIAVIQINEVITNELYMVDMDADGNFYWKSDWWEGEENVALLDYFPVSEAERRDWIPCSERMPKKNGFYLCTTKDCITILEFIEGNPHYHEEPSYVSDVLGKCNSYVVAWMPLPEPYREGE